MVSLRFCKAESLCGQLSLLHNYLPLRQAGSCLAMHLHSK